MLGQGLTEYFSMDSSLLLVVVYDTFIKGHDFEEAHTTDLHIYNLDAEPPIHVVSNQIIRLPLQLAERLRQSSASRSLAVANYVKACQSPIERAGT